MQKDQQVKTLVKVLNAVGFKFNPIQVAVLIDMNELVLDKGENVTMADIEAVVEKYIPEEEILEPSADQVNPGVVK